MTGPETVPSSAAAPRQEWISVDTDVEIALMDFASGAPPGREAELLPSLHPDEQARYRAFTHVARRESFLAGRTLLIALLARMLGRVEPAALRTADMGGVRYEAAPVHLNLSHSGGLAAAVVSPRPVGVDLERLRTRPSVQQAARVFTPDEGARVNALPEAERLEAFYILWTLKEAACKAAGLSLWEGLHGARFEPATGSANIVAPFPEGPWAFMHAGLAPGWRLAVALRGAGPGFRTGCRRLVAEGSWREEVLVRPVYLYGG
jgi:4'-phosphopantetheinyl transferase